MKKILSLLLTFMLAFHPIAGAVNYCGDANTAGAWKLDEASGTLADCTSHANTGTVTGAISYSASLKWDGALDDNNVNNANVSFGSGATIDDVFDAGGTLMFWASLDSAGTAGNVCTGGTFLSKSGDDGWEYCIDSDRTARFSDKWAGGFSIWQTNAALIAAFDGAAHFYMVYYNADSTGNVPEVQVDCGGSVGVTQTANAPFGTRNSDAALSMFMFIENDGGGGSGVGEMDGKMDDVLFYNGDLRSQCSTIMAAGIDGTHSGGGGGTPPPAGPAAMVVNTDLRINTDFRIY